MRSTLAAFSGLMFCVGQPASGEADLPWAAGGGTMLCSDLNSIPDGDLISWVRGYWTGANLYLGGSDLCKERADIAAIEVGDVRALVRVNCAGIQDSTIMVAAFNALKGLPTVAGSRSAACMAK